MSETRSRTNSGPKRFIGGTAISTNRTPPSLLTLSVSKTIQISSIRWALAASVESLGVYHHLIFPTGTVAARPAIRRSPAAHLLANQQLCATQLLGRRRDSVPPASLGHRHTG